ncbi:MAG: hypothetical protein WC794_03610 [Candidatus Doudnabacteria bacterium]|jgi:hypothetical protein
MRNKQFIIVAVMAVSVLIPSVSFAVLGTARIPTTTKVTTGTNFCTNLTAYSSQLTAKLTGGGADLKNKQEKNQLTLQERQTTREQKLTQTRDTENADRQVIYTKLMAKATTEAQKQAVIQFQATVEAAVATRRTEVDAVRKAYWDGMASAMGGRQNSVDAARMQFTNTINTAVAAAQSACTAGTDPITVRTQFNATVKAARGQFATDRKAIDKYGPQVKALVQTRNAAVKKAFDSFHTTMEQARTALKSALKV